MAAVLAEFLKLKRSLSWAVVLLLPVIMVVSGSVMTLIGAERLDHGWHTMWLRSVVFYGLFPLAVGIAILASLVWQVEHRGGNWNALMSGPTSTARILAAKATAIATLAAVMHGVLLASVIVVGKIAFDLPGMLPGEYFVASILIVLACIPVAVLQSGLSMLIRSFAMPIAVTFVGAGVSTVLLLAKINIAIFILPYALIGRATQLGTTAFGATGRITSGDIASTIIATILLTAVLASVTTATLNRRDTHS